MRESVGNRKPLVERLAEPSERRLGWSPALDGVRGASVALIMVFHFSGERAYYIQGFPIAVDLFFVMSGFLITTLLFEERQRRGNNSLREFYLRRIFRLFPALYALLAVFLLYIVAFGGDDRGRLFRELLAAGLYSYNFFIAWSGVAGQVLVQLWTLSVEEQFYFVWPIVFVWVMTSLSVRRLRLVLAVMAAFVVVWPVLRMTLDQELGAHTLSSFVFGIAIMRPDSIVLGCLGAMLFRLEPVTLGPRAQRLAKLSGDAAFVIFVMALSLGAFPHFGPFVSGFANLAVLVLVFWLVDMVRNPDRLVPRLMSHPVLVWMGKRSYGLYIWHLIVFFVVHGAVSGALPGRARLALVVAGPISFAATIMMAMISWKYIESPALEIKKRFKR